MKKRLIRIAMLAAFALTTWNCSSNGDSKDYESMDVYEFDQLVSYGDSVVVLDVRTTEEFAEGHLPNAIQIDVNTGAFRQEALRLLPKDKTIAVYCRSGRRSVAAAEELAVEGYKVVNMEGGILAWKEAGKEIEE